MCGWFGIVSGVRVHQHWEISRHYAMFATPIAYLIDEAGVITADVAVGVDGIRDLLTRAAMGQPSETVSLAAQ